MNNVRIELRRGTRLGLRFSGFLCWTAKSWFLVAEYGLAQIPKMKRSADYADSTAVQGLGGRSIRSHHRFRRLGRHPVIPFTQSRGRGRETQRGEGSRPRDPLWPDPSAFVYQGLNCLPQVRDRFLGARGRAPSRRWSRQTILMLTRIAWPRDWATITMSLPGRGRLCFCSQSQGCAHAST